VHLQTGFGIMLRTQLRLFRTAGAAALHAAARAPVPRRTGTLIAASGFAVTAVAANMFIFSGRAHCLAAANVEAVPETQQICGVKGGGVPLQPNGDASKNHDQQVRSISEVRKDLQQLSERAAKHFPENAEVLAQVSATYNEADALHAKASTPAKNTSQVLSTVVDVMVRVLQPPIIIMDPPFSSLLVRAVCVLLNRWTRPSIHNIQHEHDKLKSELEKLKHQYQENHSVALVDSSSITRSETADGKP
jgi:uncharacterized membrane-anchored protein YhcB (DUF1043 family)